MGNRALPRERIWRLIVPVSSGCWEWQGNRDYRGTGRVGNGTYHKGTSSTVLVHRVAWELTYGPIPAGLFVCHTCDNPPCCNPAHLFLGTQKDNMHDCKLKGRVFDGRATLCPGAGAGIAPQDPVTGRFMKVKST